MSHRKRINVSLCCYLVGCISKNKSESHPERPSLEGGMHVCHVQVLDWKMAEATWFGSIGIREDVNIEERGDRWLALVLQMLNHSCQNQRVPLGRKRVLTFGRMTVVLAQGVMCAIYRIIVLARHYWLYRSIDGQDLQLHLLIAAKRWDKMNIMFTRHRHHRPTDDQDQDLHLQLNPQSTQKDVSFFTGLDLFSEVSASFNSHPSHNVFWSRCMVPLPCLSGDCVRHFFISTALCSTVVSPVCWYIMLPFPE